MADECERRVSVEMVSVSAGYPRGKVILSDGSELDGIMAIGLRQRVTAFNPTVAVIEVLVSNGDRPELPETAAPRDNHSQLHIKDGQVSVMTVDAATGRTKWAGPFRLVSDAGEDAAIVGLEGVFAKDFEAHFIR